MTNYKLTTNLIADCMALIPKYLDEPYDNWVKSHLKIVKGELIYEDHHEYRNRHFDLLEEPARMYVFSHCLRTIPEFLVENAEYTKLSQYQNFPNEYDSNSDYVLNAINGGMLLPPQTIASATLHGQGEYPPSTLEELCESYKNVMSK